MLHILAVILLGTAASADFQCSVMPGRLKQVDTGAGQVFGVNDDDNIYQWVNNNWKQIPGKLIHVSVGPAGVWGVNKDNNIYKLRDNKWLPVTGLLKQVDAGGDNFLSGANKDDLIYCLNEEQTVSTSTNLEFTHIEGSLKYYSCGRFGCWGVNSANNIYYRYNVSLAACQGSRWEQIPGSLVMVEVGTDGSVYGVNSEGDAYYREGISAINPIGTTWKKQDFCGPVKHVSYDGGDLWLLTQKGDIYKCLVKGSVIPAPDLQCSVMPGRLKQIDAGDGQVFGVNNDDNIYQWVNNDWKQLPGKLIHVSVGPAGVWGVNRNNNIYKLQDNNWLQVTGLLKQVDAGGNRFLSGVNRQDFIYCLTEGQTVFTSKNLEFTQIEGSLKYYSCGPFGCWGVNSAKNIFYRHNVCPSDCQGSHWQQIPGSLVMVEVGTDGSVYGVNSEGDVYYREGISATNPVGTTWKKQDFCGPVKHVSYDGGDLWLLTKKGEIYKCLVYHPKPVIKQEKEKGTDLFADFLH